MPTATISQKNVERIAARIVANEFEFRGFRVTDLNKDKCGREISREKLIELAKRGRVAAQSPESQKKRSEAHLRHGAAKRAWRSSPKPAWLTGAIYLENILPMLGKVTISTLASTLGISESYAADIRAGRHRPHPRHWEALANLAGVVPGIPNPPNPIN